MVIWKYEIPIVDRFTINMPPGDILCVQTQEGRPCIWVKFEAFDSTRVNRTFCIAGTGNSFNDEGLVYIGTFQEFDGKLVWHLFERI